ncbi:MAG: rhodanese-like domain-containing protein, partial [Solirubrobacteraceae bacterium]
MDSPLCSADRLYALKGAARSSSLLDVRWDLAAGSRPDRFTAGHLPGALFVDLSAELAGPAGPGGRHPLPSPARFQAAMRAAGVSSRRPVVVYDDGPATAAARAWWLLRYFGHPQVLVLDGGLEAWSANGYPVEVGAPAGASEPGDFIARPGGMPVLGAQEAAALAVDGVLLDARAAERFRGEAEPVDPVAGHVPAARNRPTTETVDATGRFWPPD